MGGYEYLDSEDEAPKVTDYESGSNITLDSFFGGMESEMDEMHSEDEQPMTEVDSHEDGEKVFGRTFSNQDRLPRLPIPTLEQTANKMLQFLEALQSAPQKLHTQQQVLGFIKGDGSMLQALLREYEKEGIEEGYLGSYIEEFWNESKLVPMLEQDDGLPPSSSLNLNNPFFLLEDSPDSEFGKHPIRRAASLTMAAIKVASTIRDETFLPDSFKGQILCMDQFKAVFGTTRVPQLHEDDDIDVYPHSTHVVVMSRNQLYYFQAMWPDTGVLAVDEEDLVDILTAIERNSRKIDKTTAAEVCPGVLTTLPRQEWAQIRQALLSQVDDRNAKYLTIVESALFVLVLDDDIMPTSVEEAAANMLHGISHVNSQQHNQCNVGNQGFPDMDDWRKQYHFGSGHNRWYDKLQIIVCGDGTAGINFEHSAIDSHTALRIVSDIYAETVVQFLQSITKTLPSHGKISNIIEAPIERARKNMEYAQSQHPELDVLPKKITFEIPADIRTKIYHAGMALGDAIVASDTKVFVFREFGKKFVAANNLSPDSLTQMSIVLAYYKLYGKLVSVYEPVLTKSFFHGRTEAMRSTIVPAKEMCEIFFDTTAQPFVKLASLKRAIWIHKQMVKECAAGRGVDRHLYALKCIAERHHLSLPEFFQSEPWNMLNHSVIMAANCGNPSLRLYGIAPIVPDGFGIGYIIKDFSIHFCLTSKRRQTTRLAMALEVVLKEIWSLLQTHNFDSKIQASGTRLNDIIEEVPEGKMNTNDNALNAIYDMWGYGENHSSTPNAPKVPATAVTATNHSVTSCMPGHPLRRQDYQATEYTRSPTNTTQMTVPLAPLSDDEKRSRDDPRTLRRAPRRSRDRRSTSASSNQESSSISTSLPPIPQRRGSMFTGMSERQALTMEQLNRSGDSLNLDMSDRSDPYASKHYL